MTSYNREKYIVESIESILALNYTNWELIITDDCSTDETYKIAQQYQAKDSRIKVYKNEKNLGDYLNRNKAASYAQGVYLKYLDADDTIYKYSLDYMVEAMLANPDAALGITFSVFDDDKPYPHVSTPTETYYVEYLDKGILGCGPSAAIIKREVFEKLNGFSGKQFIGDHELWLRIAAEYNVVKLQPSLIWWRKHPEQQIQEEWKNYKIINVRFQQSLSTLLLSKRFFTDEKFKQAKIKLTRTYARHLLRMMLFERKFKPGFNLWRLSGLSFFQLLSGFKSV